MVVHLINDNLSNKKKTHTHTKRATKIRFRNNTEHKKYLLKEVTRKKKGRKKKERKKAKIRNAFNNVPNISTALRFTYTRIPLHFRYIKHKALSR